MKYKLQLSNKTLKHLKKLDKYQKIEIIKVFQRIVDNPYMFKPLRYELKGYYRARIGRYRIIFKIDKDIVFIVGIEHRKKAY
ncbi:type II toxin-antitoxin system mRNA interferase toxin, RelE/StbE family [Thermococci archaeon]|nr:MAG: type II toxin-antitoxin system mRNA interferase toxin, RelE/StbE family [Thermococci archaeon]RLG01606.1 MAG: type II toxin-antitoxin system mRNA interferase toxin, RelE/StbE family [Thermococci archaeon]